MTCLPVVCPRPVALVVMVAVGVFASASVGCSGPDYEGATVYVDANKGNDGNDGLAPTEAFRTITRAAELVSGGGQIVIAEGEYSGATGERFPLVIRSKVAVVRGAGAGRTVIVDEVGASSSVLESFGGKELSAFTLERRGDSPCPDCAVLSLDGRVVLSQDGRSDEPRRSVSVADVALVSSQPLSWALWADDGNHRVMQTELRNVVIDGKGKARGMGFSRLDAVSVNGASVTAVVTPALYVSEVAAFSGSALMLSGTSVGRGLDSGGLTASLVEIAPATGGSVTSAARVADSTLTMVLAGEHSNEFGMALRARTAVLVERTLIDMAGTAKGRGVVGQGPLELRALTVVGAEVGVGAAAGLLMRDSVFRTQSRAAVVLTSKAGVSHDLGTEADPGRNRFSLANDANADVVVSRDSADPSAGPDVTAFGNTWSMNRAFCTSSTDWPRVEAGKFQVIVVPRAGAVVRDGAERCSP